MKPCFPMPKSSMRTAGFPFLSNVELARGPGAFEESFKLPLASS